MKHRLSKLEVEKIIKMHEDNMEIIDIANHFSVTIWTIYYQIKINTNKDIVNQYIAKPQCYKDYLHNRLIDLKRQKESVADERQAFFIDAEIRRTRSAQRSVSQNPS